MPRPITFKQFILAAKQTDDPVGDLVGDLRYDYRTWGKSMPNFTTAAHLRGYLEARGACDGAIAAVAVAFKRYERRRELFAMFG